MKILSLTFITSLIVTTFSFVQYAGADNSNFSTISGFRSPLSEREQQALLLGLAKRVQVCLATSSMSHKTTSSCADVVVISEHQLQMFHHKEWYTILTKDSGDSDGGDLTDLYVYERNGVILTARTGLPGFRNIKASLLIAAKILTSL